MLGDKERLMSNFEAQLRKTALQAAELAGFAFQPPETNIIRRVGPRFGNQVFFRPANPSELTIAQPNATAGRLSFDHLLNRFYTILGEEYTNGCVRPQTVACGEIIRVTDSEDKLNQRLGVDLGENDSILYRPHLVAQVLGSSLPTGPIHQSFKGRSTIVDGRSTNLIKYFPLTLSIDHLEGGYLFIIEADNRDLIPDRHAFLGKNHSPLKGCDEYRIRRVFAFKVLPSMQPDSLVAMRYFDS